MINVAVMFLEKIKDVIAGLLSGRLDVNGQGLFVSVLSLFIFEWLIFTFIYWLRSIMSRRG